MNNAAMWLDRRTWTNAGALAVFGIVHRNSEKGNTATKNYFCGRKESATQMITRTPEDEERIKELTKELAKLVESNDELYLLITFIREFFRVKEEYKAHRLKQGKLKIIKPRR